MINVRNEFVMVSKGCFNMKLLFVNDMPNHQFKHSGCISYINPTLLFFSQVPMFSSVLPEFIFVNTISNLYDLHDFQASHVYIFFAISKIIAIHPLLICIHLLTPIFHPSLSFLSRSIYLSLIHI